jgi:hypothetical protein
MGRKCCDNEGMRSDWEQVKMAHKGKCRSDCPRRLCTSVQKPNISGSFQVLSFIPRKVMNVSRERGRNSRITSLRMAEDLPVGQSKFACLILLSISL